jgi:hypothetical protein
MFFTNGRMGCPNAVTFLSSHSGANSLLYSFLELPPANENPGSQEGWSESRTRQAFWAGVRRVAFEVSGSLPPPWPAPILVTSSAATVPLPEA